MYNIGDKIRISIEHPAAILARLIDGQEGTIINVTPEGYVVQLSRGAIIEVAEHEVISYEEYHASLV